MSDESVVTAVDLEAALVAVEGAAHVPNLRLLADRPFELLQAIEAQVRNRASGARDAWVGLAFRSGEHWMVAPRNEVREVVPPPDATRVPGAKSWLLGVANLRGSVMTLIDLRACIGEGSSTIRRTSRVLVCPATDGQTGFLVDEVSGYRRFTPVDQSHSAVDTLPEGLRDFALGAFNREGQIWPVMSFTQLLEVPALRDAGL